MDKTKNTLRRQLNRFYLFAIFIPIFLIGTYLLYNNYNLIMSHHKDMLISENLRVRSIVFEVTTSMMNICDNISEDKNLAEILTTTYDNSNDVRSILNEGTVIDEFYGRHTELSSVTIYTTNQTLIDHEHFKVLSPAQQRGSWFQKAINRSGYYWQTSSRTDSYGVTYHELELTYRLPINDKGMAALLVITVSDNYLKNRIDNNDMDAELLTDDGFVFFSTSGNKGVKETFPIDYTPTTYNYSGTSDHWGDRRLVEVSNFKPIKTEDKIYILSTNISAIPETRKVLWITFATVGLSLFIPLFLIVKYNTQLTNRVNTLKTEMHRVSEGNYDIIETFKGNDELVELFNDLKVMIASIKSRDRTIYDAMIKEQLLINHQQKMEMALLSSKINPHFLYNTLETIRMKAFAVGAKDVAEAVKLLGHYMRHNLEHSGELVSLATELQFIEVYLAIQKLRFADRIESSITIDDDVDKEAITLLPLMIQPVVENAILHGHEETIEDGRIDIAVSILEDTLYIRVIDNGTGISKERLEWIQARFKQTPEETKGSIGLMNIHHRIKLYYGEDYGLSIHNNPGGGTIVTLTFPICKKEALA